MSGRRSINTVAKPTSIRFTEKNGYQMVAKIVEGTQALLDKTIIIPLTAAQLDKINNWNPELSSTEKTIDRLDL